MRLIKKIYADTSVFGGSYDKEFKTASNKFFEQVRMGLFDLVTSAVVQGEIVAAPHNVRELFDDMLDIAEIAEVTKEAISLQQAYLKEKIVAEKWLDDALHVSLATVARCDAIVSWNFRHIVHADKIPLYNAVNVLHGYRQILIYSPLEIIHYEKY